jgi:methionine-rich copper-binding protein CopC
MKSHPVGICLALAMLWTVPSLQAALAHAFPERMEPRVGAATESIPGQIRIWFDADLEPAFSTLRVLDSQGRQVNRDSGQVNAGQARLLEARVPPLAPGVYHVYWRVIARDGHATEGDYSFTVGR